MRKAKIISLALASLLVLSSMGLSGCKSNTVAKTAKSGVTNVTVEFWGGDDDKKIWQENVDNVNKVYPNVKATLQLLDWTTYWQKLQAQVAAGTAPDVLGCRDFELPAYQRLGAFTSLDSYIGSHSSEVNLDDFDSTILNAMKYQGKLYVLPYDYGPSLLFYNKDLFDKYKVSYPTDTWTWDDLRTAAKKMTSKANLDYGFATDGQLYLAAMTYGMENGATFFNSKGQLTLSDPKAISGIQFFADLINVDKCAPTVSDLTSSSLSERWYAGHIAMYVDGPWSIINTKQNSKFGFRVAAMPLSPTTGKRTAPSAGSGFCVYSKTKVSEAAIQTVIALTNKDSEKNLAAAGRAFSARKSQQEVYFDNANIEGLKDAMNAALKDSVGVMASTNYQEAETFVNNNVLQPIFYGKAKAADIIPQYDEQVKSTSVK
jgi:ABC-type glycerol-3-phosphate transport system substrate-binding protein